MKKINFKDVNAGTIGRTLVLVLGLANAALKLMGKEVLPIGDEQINAGITASWAVGASLWAWWKNNSFTKNAIEADNYKESLKQDIDDEPLTDEEIAELEKEEETIAE